MEWRLTETETVCKEKMLGEYKSQPALASISPLDTERIRAATHTDFSIPQCHGYSYEDRRTRLGSSVLLKRFVEFVAQVSRGLPA